MAEDHPGAAPGQAQENLIPGVKHVIAVSSGKGGVGKSTVAVNLAVALQQLGARIGLMDADVYGPNIPMMMGVTEPPEQQDGKIKPAESHGVKLISMGFFVPEDGGGVAWPDDPYGDSTILSRCRVGRTGLFVDRPAAWDG